MTIATEITADSFTILDGGMGGEIQRRSGQKGGLWSAQALIDAPDMVRDIHAEYIQAGARVIITNSYSTIPSYLAKGGLQDEYPRYASLAGEIAREAAQAASETVWVAGSIPPLSESYRADLVPGTAEAVPVYAKLVEMLTPHVDLFVCETMSSIAEAVNASQAVRQVIGSEKPLWVAWTLAEQPGGGLRSGESIEDAVAALAPYEVDAYLFNCTTPAAISGGLETLRALTDKPIGAYPNRIFIPAGWTLDNEVNSQSSEMSVTEFLEFVQEWRRAGANIVGGCCGIGPEFIEALAEAS